MLKITLFLTTMLCGICQEYTGDPILKNEQNPQVMTLGTFHFAFKQNDAHKTKKEKLVDVLTEERQRELDVLVDRLKRFKPTKILVEWRDSEITNRLYREYRDGKHREKRNEVYQLAFRIANELGHSRVYTADAKGVWYKHITDSIDGLTEQYKKWRAENQARIDAKNWGERYSTHYENNDNYKLKNTLIDVFKKMNSPTYIKEAHGTYLTTRFDFETEERSYTGVDAFVSMWYNRNLRMFRNIKRAINSTSDRVLFIVGAGHLPILNHAIDYSPDVDYVSPLTVLKD